MQLAVAERLGGGLREDQLRKGSHYIRSHLW
jgi:hypothetical protein